MPPHLSEAARASLKRTLDQAEEAMSYESARGAFAAFATMPALVAASSWFGLVLGDTPFENFAEGREVIDQLMLLYCEVAEHIEHDTLAACPRPSDADAVGDWAHGYLSAVALDDSFEDDFTSPVLAALNILDKPEIAPELDDEQRNVLRAKLPELVSMLYLYFEPTRQQSALHLRGPIERSIPAQAATKLGRNDPCPCGSGKKFKRCCAV